MIKRLTLTTDHLKLINLIRFEDNELESKLSVDKIMQWQKSELTEPLLKMPDTERPVALQMFRNLLSYMIKMSFVI